MAYNVASGGIPVIVVGRGDSVLKSVATAIKPEYDAVHACFDATSSVDEIPQILLGSQDVLPSSNIGSNITRKPGEEHPFPKAILIGGGLSQEEYEQIVNAVKEKTGQEAPGGVRWLKATREMYPSDLPPGEPPVELIVEVAKKMLGTIA